MQTPAQKTVLPQSPIKPRQNISTASVCGRTVLAALSCVLAALPACAATTNFLNVASVASGGSYGLDNLYWNTTSEVATPLVDFVAGDYVTIGANPSDFNGYSFSIPFNYSASTHFTGSGSVVAIYATNVMVTLNGADNDYLDGATTFYVAPGSTLIEDVTWDNYGLNFDNQTVTLAGGGTITFQAQMGANSTGLITQNMPGGTNNLEAGKAGDFLSGGYTLTAGTLNFATAAAATAFSGFSTKSFTINGGNVDNTSGSSMTLGFGTATNILGGNFTFIGSSSLDFGPAPWTNTANHAITIVQNELAIGGGIRGAGTGLSLLGNGTLSLYGASTYTGNTLVLGGTLALTNAGSLTSPLILVSNATFDISGLAGNDTGPSAIGLTNSTFNLSNALATAVSALGVTNSTLNISELAAGTTNIVTTTLNMGGGANVINITSLPLVTSYPQTNHLILATTVNGTLNFTLGTLPSASPAYTASIINRAAGLVDLVLTSGPAPVRSLVWSGLDNGAPDGMWDEDTTPTWLAGGTPTTFNPLDFATFDDTAAGSTTVNITGGLTPGSLTVSNNTLTYTFTDGSINNGNGPLTLAKKGTGTLILQESGDNFSGGINVSAGTVMVDNNSSGISGGTLIAAGATVQLGNNDTGDYLPGGAVTDNGTLVFNCADIPTTVNTEILGTGLVEQVNTNTVVLADSGASSGSWSVLVTNGTLQAEDNTALGSLPGGSVTITNGGTFDVGANSTANNANFGTKQFYIAGAGVGGNGAIVNSSLLAQEDAFENINLTANATIGGTGRWDMRNGSPLLTLNGFTLTKTNANQNSLVNVHVTTGNIVIQQGILSFEVTPNFDASTGTITVNSGGYVGQYEDTLGSFTRAIVLNGGGNANLSAANTTAWLDAPIMLTANSPLIATVNGSSEVYNGVISDGGLGFGLILSNLTAVIYSTNKMSATNTYTGATAVAQGLLALTNHGSIACSALITVTNGATFDVSELAIPFSGTNSLVLGDDYNGSGIFNLGANLMTNFNYLSLSNATVNLSVANASVPPITVTNLNLGDGTSPSTINIVSLPLIVSAQFPLIKYANLTGTYTLYVSFQNSSYSGNLVNNTANHSIDLQITGLPPGIWNGGGAASGNTNWSDAANWTGESLTGSSGDVLAFTGVVGLESTNDTPSETADAITFLPGAGAFTLIGNPVVLGNPNGQGGGVTNNSSNIQTINLGLDFGSNGTNAWLNGGSTAATELIVGGGLTNTADLVPGYTSLTLSGYGVLTNLLNSVNSPGGTNVLFLSSASANWTLLNNASSTPTSVPWDFQINAGTFSFGSASSAPTLASTSLQGVPQDNQVGDMSGTTGTLNMINGTWTTTARLNTALATSSTGMVSQVGGTLTIGGQFQGANGSNTNEYSIVSLTGGTMNIGSAATPTGQFYLASRGNGSLTLSNSATLNCGNLDISRNANGNTAGSVGVVNLNGGTLDCSLVGTATANAQTGPPSITSATPSATFNFNGGTLEARGSSATFFQGSLVAPIIPITAIVKAGGAIINDGGFAITIATPLIHDPMLGTTPDGGLLKLGAGTLTMTGASTYTGNTIVSNGVLAVDGSLAAGSAVLVGTNGTLSGTGGLDGNTTVYGTIEPGTTTTAGVLTCLGNLTIIGTNTAKLDLNNSTNDEVFVGGTLTYGGTLNVVLLSGTPVLGNSYKLFSASSPAGSFTATNLPALGAGLAWNWNPASAILSVVASGPGTFTNPTGITSINLTASGNVVITATNGQSGDAYYLLETTNLSLPINQWIPVATNVLSTTGNFTFTGTNVVVPGDAQQFYILSNTNN